MYPDDEVKKPLLPNTYQTEHVLPGGATTNSAVPHQFQGGGSQGHSHHGHTHGEFADDHSDVGDGGLRAIVFGFADGLVTNLCLILGIYTSAGNIDHRTVILTGIAGLLAGGCSMAIGEWISMKFQQEANEAQLLLERRHLKEYPKDEANHFRRILKENGLSKGACEIIARDLEKTTINQQVKWHALLELKIDPEELGGSPWKAACASFVGFSTGAFIPLLPWICTRVSPAAFYITIVLAIVCIILLGLVSGVMYNFPREKLAVVVIRQVVLVAVACAVVIGVNNGISRLVTTDASISR